MIYTLKQDFKETSINKYTTIYWWSLTGNSNPIKRPLHTTFQKILWSPHSLYNLWKYQVREKKQSRKFFSQISQKSQTRWIHLTWSTKIYEREMCDEVSCKCNWNRSTLFFNFSLDCTIWDMLTLDLLHCISLLTFEP